MKFEKLKVSNRKYRYVTSRNILFKISSQEYSVTFSSYFNVLWNEPRLHISPRFLDELNMTEGGGDEEKMIPGKK